MRRKVQSATTRFAGARLGLWKATLWLVLWLVVPLANTGSATTPSASNWPMFRGGPALLGVADGKLDDNLTLLWSFKSGGPIKSSAAVVGGKVFIGSGDMNVYA